MGGCCTPGGLCAEEATGMSSRTTLFPPFAILLLWDARRRRPFSGRCPWAAGCPSHVDSALQPRWQLPSSWFSSSPAPRTHLWFHGRLQAPFATTTYLGNMSKKLSQQALVNQVQDFSPCANIEHFSEPRSGEKKNFTPRFLSPPQPQPPPLEL